MRAWITVLRILVTIPLVIAANASALTVLLLLLLGAEWRGSAWFIDLAVNFAPFYFIPPLALLALAALALWRVLSLRWIVPLLLAPLVVWAVAVIRFGPYFVPRLNSVLLPQSPSLRVVTHNMHLDNAQTAQLVIWLNELDADIALIQEMPRHWGARNTAQWLQDRYPYRMVQERYPRSGAGNALFSRLPIIETSTFQLTALDRFMQQRAVIATSAGEIAVYNIHLMPNYGDFPRLRLPGNHSFLNIALSYEEESRRQQIDALLAMLHTERLPFIVGGDFNTSEYSVLYDILTATLGDTFREAGYGFGFTWPASTVSDLPAVVPPLLRIDYLFHSPALPARAAWLGPALGSDHLPVVGEYALIPG